VAAILVAATGTAVAVGTGAAQAADLEYVALGDSFSSGVGAGNYDAVEPQCKRSFNAYSHRWIGEFSEDSFTTFKVVACSGATTVDVQAKQLSALSDQTTMVTMTIGGNDLGFASVITLCLLTTIVEDVCIDEAEAAGIHARQKMGPILDALYKNIRAAAPNAKVFILGYPHIFETGPCGTFALGPEARTQINNATSLLNTTIAEVVTANGFTFVEAEKLFQGRGVCTTANGGAWLTDTSAGADAYHPNRDGQEVYAVGLDAAVRGVGLPS